jgi:hypothetical protein
LLLQCSCRDGRSIQSCSGGRVKRQASLDNVKGSEFDFA